MKTIFFSQCTNVSRSSLNRNGIEFLIGTDIVGTLCIQSKIKLWEEFVALNSKQSIFTFDEHVILIAQALHRQGKMRFELVDLCACPPCYLQNTNPHYYEQDFCDCRLKDIYLDDDGDFLVEPFHSLFSERLEYLR